MIAREPQLDQTFGTFANFCAFLDPAPGDALEIFSVFVDCVGRTRIVHVLAQEPVEVLVLPLSIVRVDVANAMRVF
jgi:hypothetical protein